MSLIAAKIAITPALMWAVSAAARRWLRPEPRYGARLETSRTSAVAAARRAGMSQRGGIGRAPAGAGPAGGGQSATTRAMAGRSIAAASHSPGRISPCSTRPPRTKADRAAQRAATGPIRGAQTT